MSIAKPFTFTANTYAKASEVNANFDTVYSQVNSNISAISQNTVDIDNLENNKADINGSSTQVFAVANPESGNQAVNKQYLMSAIGNSLDYISGYTITKYSNNAIIVSAGSCYDSGKTVVLAKSASTTKTNSSQSAGVTYYVYVIGNNTGSSTDILITTSSTVPGLPSGYTKYRQIGKYTTDSDNKISEVYYYGVNPDSDKNVTSIINSCMPDYSNGTNKSVNTKYQASTNICLWIVCNTNNTTHKYIYVGQTSSTVNIPICEFWGNVGAHTSQHYYIPKGWYYICDGTDTYFGKIVEFPLVGG